MTRARRPTLSLPLVQAEGNLMLIVIVAVLVFLAGIVWIVGGAAHHMTGRWDHALANQLTIEILPKLDENETMTSEQRIQRVKEILAQYNVITNIETVPREKLQAVLKPWLGDVSSFADLPLPTLLEVSLQPGHDLDFDDLARHVSQAVPGVNVVAHYAWAGDVQRIASVIMIIAWAAIAFIAGVLVLVMVFAARTRLAMYASEIEILHTLGASDGFVAGEFGRQSLGLSALGAAIGFLMLMVVLTVTWMFVNPDENVFQFINNNQLEILQDWQQSVLGLLFLPFGVVLLNSFASRLAVQSALRRLT